MRERLYRSRTERMFLGVAGGLAEWFDVDPAFVRIAFVLLTVPGGIGVQASAQAGLTALNVDGRVKFSRSGRTTIASGASSKVVALAGVTTASYVVATLQTNRAGVWIQAVLPAAGKFTVYLNKATVNPAKVAWFVIG